MLRLENVVVAQGSFRLAADWAVAAGERVAVIGPSGAGKSTLLMAIAGFVPACTGSDPVGWAGSRAACPRRASGERAVSGPEPVSASDPAQNLGLGLSPDLRLTAEDGRRIAAALERSGWRVWAHGGPARCPAGNRAARRWRGRCCGRGRCLLLDEPFAALGPALKAEMLGLVEEIAQDTGATVLMVTHDPGDARRFAGKVVLVADGEASMPRPTAELFADPPAALSAYLGG